MNMKLLNTRKQKTRPIGRMQIRKASRALSVRSDVVNEAGPSSYVMMVKYRGNSFEPYGKDTQISDFLQQRRLFRWRHFAPPTIWLSKSLVLVWLYNQVRTHFTTNYYPPPLPPLIPFWYSTPVVIPTELREAGRAEESLWLNT